MGEAAQRIPEEFKEKHPDIPWHQMAGMRNRLIHEYINVDFRIVWKAVKEDFPKAEPLVKQALDKLS